MTRRILATLIAVSLLMVANPAASAAEDDCGEGLQDRTVPGVRGTFCYDPAEGHTFGRLDDQGRGYLFIPDNDNNPANTPPRALPVPSIPSTTVFDEWLQHNQTTDDVYVIVADGWVRRKEHPDGTTRCYFHGNDGSLYNYGEC